MPAPDPGVVDVAVVGAGIAGLTAASRLERAGRSVVVLDKGRSVGGRLATRRLGGATLDHGAQFLTARSDAFVREVGAWVSAGVVHEWCRGFDDVPDGHPRYAARGGMNRIATQLATAVADVRVGVQVMSVGPAPAGWQLTWAGGALTAGTVILTAPVPQSLALLDAGGSELGPDVAAGLRAITYEPTIALLLVLDGPPAVPHPGARKPQDGPFDIVVDNVAKGASTEPALTLHLRPALSATRSEEADGDLLDDLVPRAADWIGDAAVLEAVVKRWRYATPTATWPDACCTAATGPAGPVVLAGDAFAGPRVEGAWLSGVAAAEAATRPAAEAAIGPAAGPAAEPAAGPAA